MKKFVLPNNKKIEEQKLRMKSAIQAQKELSMQTQTDMELPVPIEMTETVIDTVETVVDVIQPIVLPKGRVFTMAQIKAMSTQDRVDFFQSQNVIVDNSNMNDGGVVTSVMKIIAGVAGNISAIAIKAQVILDPTGEVSKAYNSPIQEANDTVSIIKEAYSLVKQGKEVTPQQAILAVGQDSLAQKLSGPTKPKVLKPTNKRTLFVKIKANN